MKQTDGVNPKLEQAQRALETALDLLLEMGLEQRRRRVAAERRRAARQERDEAQA